MNRISETDLILNTDGSVYHLNLLPEDVADTVITVGDQDRVPEVTKYFDHIEVKKGKREFVTHTGRISNKRITVISTGIGTDNIDIVLNELDALVNIDFETREVKQHLKSLDIIRIGTSGAIQSDIAVDTLLVSTAAFGLDSLMHYYEQQLNGDEQFLLRELEMALPLSYRFKPYIASASEQLLYTLGEGLQKGITISAPGFYSPQGREVRAISKTPQLMDILQQFNVNNNRITNLEMETAGIYGLAGALGHNALSFNVILANRVSQIFSKEPLKVMDNFIKEVLERLIH